MYIRFWTFCKTYLDNLSARGLGRAGKYGCAMNTLDVKQMIQVMFGGARALYESLPAETRPKLNTIQKWESRGNLPRDGLVMLLNELEDRTGAPVSMKPFTRSSECSVFD